MAAGVTMRQMLEAGVHFGHQTRRWNPHMRPFIFTERNGIHILDLAQTVRRLDAALQKVRDVTSAGQTVLFVGTKKQARTIVAEAAGRANMPYVNNRWLGGTLTNWITVSRRIQHMLQLEERIQSGDTLSLPKRERLSLEKEHARLQRAFGGMRDMTRLPGALFIVDPTVEEIAVMEGGRIGIPIIAMCDTNADPDNIEFPIPSNDDAIRAIQLITARIADAALEGRAVGEVEDAYEAQHGGAPAAAEPVAGTEAPASEAPAVEAPVAVE
ncbi:MAG: 30S ribosomal protein S2 [Dehalococcoidia bacterium]|nr:30S ribosomal protein S2 [Dehalococcoidia bacterium]